jgi:hypothetical protein
MNDMIIAILGEARRRDKLDPIKYEQALLERAGLRFSFPLSIWNITLDYLRVRVAPLSSPLTTGKLQQLLLFAFAFPPCFPRTTF